MMLKPSIDTLLDKVPSKYSLVILEAKRAHELEAGAPATQEFKSEKSTLRALEEIESGNVTIHPDPCLLYTSPRPRDRSVSRMPSSA